MATLSRNYNGVLGAWSKKRDERTERAVKGTFVSDAKSSKKLAAFVAATKSDTAVTKPKRKVVRSA
jgi:hypothetical protein